MPESKFRDFELARLHGLYQQTGNSLCVWQAIWWCRDGEPSALPDWCLQYLGEVASAFAKFSDQVARGEIDAQEASQGVPAALGLVRKGWNAFRREVTTATQQQLAIQYLFDRKHGISSAQATENVREAVRVEEERSARRLIADGLKLLRANERAKPPG
jgi:hypothetical protein